MRDRNNIIFILFFAVLGGCAPAAPSVRHTTGFPAGFALLPLSSEALDLRAPELLRSLFDTYFSAANFNLADIQETDEKLKTLGVSEGGQLNAYTPKKLAQVLGADALLYGDIEEFNNANIGVYAKRIVKVRLWLVDGKTGETIWESERSNGNAQLGLSKAAAKDILISGYAEKAAENIMNNPLRPEAEEVVRLLVRDLGKARRDW